MNNITSNPVSTATEATAREVASMLVRATDAISQSNDRAIALSRTIRSAEPWHLQGTLPSYLETAERRKHAASDRLPSLRALHRACQLAAMRDRLHRDLAALPAQIDAAQKEADHAMKQAAATAKKALHAATEAAGAHQPLAARLAALSAQIDAQEAAAQSAVDQAQQQMANAGGNLDAIQQASEAQALALLRRKQFQDGNQAIQLERDSLAQMEQDAAQTLSEKESEASTAEQALANAQARRLACDADRAALQWLSAWLGAVRGTAQWGAQREAATLSLLTVPVPSLSQVCGESLRLDAAPLELMALIQAAGDVDAQALANARNWLAQDKADEAKLAEGEAERQSVWKQLQVANPHGVTI